MRRVAGGSTAPLSGCITVARRCIGYRCFRAAVHADLAERGGSSIGAPRAEPVPLPEHALRSAALRVQRSVLVVLLSALTTTCAPSSAPSPPVRIADPVVTHFLFAAAIEYTARKPAHTPPFAIGSMADAWDVWNDDSTRPVVLPGIDASW